MGEKNKVNKIKIKVNKRLLSLPRTHIRMGVYMDVVKWRTGQKGSGAGTEPRDQVREAIKYRSGVCVAVQTKTKWGFGFYNYVQIGKKTRNKKINERKARTDETTSGRWELDTGCLDVWGKAFVDAGVRFRWRAFLGSAQYRRVGAVKGLRLLASSTKSCQNCDTQSGCKGGWFRQFHCLK